MGLLRAFASAVASELADQYLEYFYCDSLSNDVLVARGTRKDTKRSRDHGNPEVINNGSGVVVNAGQCAIIASQGTITEVCAEPGVYTYNSSTESSVFGGSIEYGISQAWEQIKKRTAFGGETPTDQRVYYINLKEILDNKFGTSSPLPFRIVDARTGIDFDLNVRCRGTYTFRIQDPVLFYTSIAGNMPAQFTKAQISNQLREELINGMIPAFDAIAARGIRYSEIGRHAEEIRTKIMESLGDKWIKRGIYLESISFDSIDIPPEDLERIKDIQYEAVYTNSSMLGAKLGVAQAEAMKSAAANPNAGPMMAFAGMNMANMAGANTGFGGMVANGPGVAPVQVTPTPAPASAPTSWTCSCGASNTGNFCSECGAKKPAADGWECPNCKAINKGKFCSECGTKKPENAFLS